MNNVRYLFLVFAVVLMGCGGGVDTSGSVGGAGGTTSTGDGGVVVSTVTTTSTSATTATTETPCEPPGALPCGPAVPGAYPDIALAYDPAQAVHGPLYPYPGTPEVGSGAGAGRVGPFAEDRAIVAATFVLADVPDAVRVAVPVEVDNCGLPAVDPNTLAVDIAGPFASEPFGALGDVLVTVPLPSPVAVPAGASAWPARIMASQADYVMAIDPAASPASRSAWWGVVDNDCDGVTDAALGWASLAAPTSPEIAPYDYDLGIGVVLAPPAPAPPPIVQGDCCPRGCKCPR